MQRKRSFESNRVPDHQEKRFKSFLDGPARSDHQEKRFRSFVYGPAVSNHQETRFKSFLDGPAFGSVEPNSESYQSTHNNVASTSLSGRSIPGRSQSPPHNQPHLDANTKSTNEIMKYYNTQAQGKKQFTLKMELVNKLFAMLQRKYPGCGLYLTGSSVNGFGEKNSDTDLCLMLKDPVSDRSSALAVLSKVRNMLYAIRNISRPILIKATVPILDFVDHTSGTECDMCVNNAASIKNSHLLACYSNFDRRVAPLVIFVKRWARFQNINSAKESSFSSYVLALMVINYLQCGVGSKPVLPCLQQQYPSKFPDRIETLRNDHKFPPIPAAQRNTDSVATLLTGFFHYYAHKFDFTKSVASVRTGSVLDFQTVRHRVDGAGVRPEQAKGKRNSWDACVFVEDPLEPTLNAARNLFDKDKFAMCLRKFRQTDAALSSTGLVESIVTHPF